MEGISDIKIVGIDAKRPPLIQKAPYIDLFFQLSHAVPEEWAKDFNGMLSKHKHPAKVQPGEPCFIETWVRTPDDVSEHLELLKSKIIECNDKFIARIEQSGKEGDGRLSSKNDTGEQGRLNRIIETLDFDA